jgi:DNA-binding NarL/FixJ family response regulator
MEIKPLTKRQLEFLSLAGKGLSYKEIAKECTVSVETVRATFINTRQRIGANSNSHAIVKAVARNEIEISSDGVCFPIIK